MRCWVPSFVKCRRNHSNDNNKILIIMCHHLSFVMNVNASNNIVHLVEFANANEPKIKYLYHFTWHFGFLGERRKSFYSPECIWQNLWFFCRSIFMRFVERQSFINLTNWQWLCSEIRICNSSFIIIIPAIDIKCDAPTINTPTNKWICRNTIWSL